MTAHQNVSRSASVVIQRVGAPEAIIACVIVLVIAGISVAVQQTIFHRFVTEVGGRPDGLFKTTRGDYFRLWSYTVPLWATTAVIITTAATWFVRFRRRGNGWLTVVFWLVYVAIVWSLTVASSGLIDILGRGEVFI
jgi:hypothetical protein